MKYQRTWKDDAGWNDSNFNEESLPFKVVLFVARVTGGVDEGTSGTATTFEAQKRAKETEVKSLMNEKAIAVGVIKDWAL